MVVVARRDSDSHEEVEGDEELCGRERVASPEVVTKLFARVARKRSISNLRCAALLRQLLLHAHSPDGAYDHVRIILLSPSNASHSPVHTMYNKGIHGR